MIRKDLVGQTTTGNTAQVSYGIVYCGRGYSVKQLQIFQKNKCIGGLRYIIKHGHASAYSRIKLLLSKFSLSHSIRTSNFFCCCFRKFTYLKYLSKNNPYYATFPFNIKNHCHLLALKIHPMALLHVKGRGGCNQNML